MLHKTFLPEILKSTSKKFYFEHHFIMNTHYKINPYKLFFVKKKMFEDFSTVIFTENSVYQWLKYCEK